MQVVLVTGSREEQSDVDAEDVRSVVSWFDHVIVGCARGVDAIAREYAEDAGLGLDVLKADWTGLGRRAGMERNERLVARAVEMAADGHDVECVAFPGPNSRGTWNCVRLARAAGLVVSVHRVSA